MSGSLRVKVTIPIDWDQIIDKHIKNTNTNVMEVSKAVRDSDRDD